MGRTLRDVSARSAVSLGYLSEIERGEKEASSELVASICYALDMPVSEMLRAVAANVAREEAAAGVVVNFAVEEPGESSTPVVHPQGATPMRSPLGNGRAA